MLLLSVDPARHSVNLITPLTSATIKIYFRSADLISSEEKERERERERERATCCVQTWGGATREGRGSSQCLLLKLVNPGLEQQKRTDFLCPPASV